MRLYSLLQNVTWHENVRKQRQGVGQQLFCTTNGSHHTTILSLCPCQFTTVLVNFSTLFLAWVCGCVKMGPLRLEWEVWSWDHIFCVVMLLMQFPSPVWHYWIPETKKKKGKKGDGGGGVGGGTNCLTFIDSFGGDTDQCAPSLVTSA